MLGWFKTKQLVFLALVGAVLFITDFAVSGVLDTVTGIPGLGWMASSIYWFAIAIIGALTVRKFGSATIMAFIYSVLAVPVQLMGPPGLQKIALGVGIGLIVDLILFIFKYKRLGYYIAPFIANGLAVLGLFGMLFLLGLPGAKEMQGALLLMTLLGMIEALFGAWIGVLIYEKKLKNKRIFKQIGD